MNFRFWLACLGLFLLTANVALAQRVPATEEPRARDAEIVREIEKLIDRKVSDRLTKVEQSIDVIEGRQRPNRWYQVRSWLASAYPVLLVVGLILLVAFLILALARARQESKVLTQRASTDIPNEGYSILAREIVDLRATIQGMQDALLSKDEFQRQIEAFFETQMSHEGDREQRLHELLQTQLAQFKLSLDALEQDLSARTKR